MPTHSDFSGPFELGAYSVLEILGSGGFGTVFRAVDKNGNEVAIKLLSAHLASNPEFRKRFEREISVLQSVQSSYTVKVIEVLSNGDSLGLVMDYVPGPTLEEFVMQNGAIRGQLFWLIAQHLVIALNDIHSYGVIHRDLKPSNVIYGPDGVRVLDFGISALADQTSITQTGAFIGTAGWISPEQIVDGSSSQKSDTFNLGLTLGYLALGRHPFGLGRSDALMYRICHTEPDLFGLEPDILDLLERCLQKNPSSRAEISSLAGMFASEVSSYAPMSVEVPVRSAEEPPAPSIENDATLLVPPLGGFKSIKQEPDIHTSPRPPRRRNRATPVAVILLMAAVVGGVAWRTLDRVDETGDSAPAVTVVTSAPPLATQNDRFPNPNSSSVAPSPAENQQSQTSGEILPDSRPISGPVTTPSQNQPLGPEPPVPTTPSVPFDLQPRVTDYSLSPSTPIAGQTFTINAIISDDERPKIAWLYPVGFYCKQEGSLIAENRFAYEYQWTCNPESYESAGNYQFGLEITDANNEQHDLGKPFSIPLRTNGENTAPASISWLLRGPSGTQRFYDGDLVTLEAVFSDPDRVESASVTWVFGDPSNPNRVAISSCASQGATLENVTLTEARIRVSCVVSAPDRSGGQFSANVTVTDSLGATRVAGFGAYADPAAMRP